MGTLINKLMFTFIVVNCFLFSGIINAANWLTLQNITDSPYPLTWGFIQPSYMQTSGSTLPAGPWMGQKAAVNVMQPDLSSSRIFQIQRARVGIRGALPDNEKISYFVLAEYGNNGITQPGGGAGKVTLTDATLTFTHLKGAKVRVGQMKVPMSEEIYQGILTSNYINLSNIANQQLVERPFWTDGNANCSIAAGSPPGRSNDLYLRFCNGDSQLQFRSTSVAARDIGVQIFDSFRVDAWEHSYAFLIGQGGANKDNRNDSLDTTVYFSSERIFGGEKAFRKGYKLYAWRTSGKRTLYDSNVLNAGSTSLEAAEREYDRNLTGLGGTCFVGKNRFWAEMINVDGMIFNGTTGGAVPGSVNNGGSFPGVFVSQFKTEPNGEGDGGYIDYGYRVKPDIELDIRYDWYNRVTNLLAADELKFETWTLGAQYFFTDTTKVIVNYEIRNIEAPGLPSSDMVNEVAKATDNRLSLQLFTFF